jgi:hypothetical protein
MLRMRFEAGGLAITGSTPMNASANKPRTNVSGRDTVTSTETPT